MLASHLSPAAMVVAGIGPALLLLWLVVAADSRPEPPRVVWTAVVLGAVVALPVGILELWIMKHVAVVHNPWLASYENALLFAAIPEEAAKVSLIALVALRARSFDEPMDGVVYGTAVGLGFAAVENVLYLVGSTNWAFLAVVRGVLTVPFHGALGAIAGAYIARARFGGLLAAHSTWRRPRLFLLAWLIPVILHTAFDGSLFSLKNANADTGVGVAETVAGLLVAAVVGFGAIIFAALLARRIAHRQKAWLQTKRLPPTHWRAVWAQCLIAVGLCFAALTLIVAGGSGIGIIGWLLLIVTAGISWKCGRYLNTAAIRRHRSHAASPS